MLTQIQENIITNLVKDNKLIVDRFTINGMRVRFDSGNIQARLDSIVNYCLTLYIETVYNETNTNRDYIQNRLVNLLVGIIRYRNDYNNGTSIYVLFNSLFDKTLETLNDFNETL
jgi:hypothetical protein